VIDNQILSSAISALGGVLAGFAGGKYNSKHQADRKCEKVCALMIGGFDKLLVALDVVGEPVEIKHVIRDARDTVSRAKALMNLDGNFDPTHDIK
jgi:hypothetical protein